MLAKMATLTEIETSWSLDDVLRGNAILDMQAELNKPPEIKKK